MKLYAYKNDRCKSDFITKNSLAANHSSTLLILAPNEEEAIKAAKEITEIGDMDEITEIPTIKAGLVVYADGEC